RVVEQQGRAASISCSTVEPAHQRGGDRVVVFVRQRKEGGERVEDQHVNAGASQGRRQLVEPAVLALRCDLLPLSRPWPTETPTTCLRVVQQDVAVYEDAFCCIEREHLACRRD